MATPPVRSALFAALLFASCTSVATFVPSPSPSITPFLWFEDRAEQAAHFYASVFRDARVIDPVRTPEEVASGKGAPMAVTFELQGQRFHALNGGPLYRFNEAISFQVACDDQAEIDRLWARLTEGGEPGRCGWLKDRYGLSWQVVPAELPALLADPDPARAARVAETLMTMDKLDIEALRAAHRGDG